MRMRALVPLLLLLVATAAAAQPPRDPLIASTVARVDAGELQRSVETLVSFGTRNTFSATTGVTGIGAAREWIFDQFEQIAQQSAGRMTVAFDQFTAVVNGRSVEIVNVIATLAGTDAADTRVVMISGHYDSRASNTNDGVTGAPGANDDASGTAVTIEAARVLATSRLPCTLVFVAFAAEEQGLIGSAHLADVYVRAGVNLYAMLNNDIVGGALYSSDTKLRNNLQVRLFSETGDTGVEDDSPQRQLARYVKEIAERYVDQLSPVLIYRRDRYNRGGDQTSFTNEGFNAIRITEMNENFVWQHQDVREEGGVAYGDVPENVDFDYVRKVTQMNVAAAMSLAYAPGSPRTASLNTAQLSNEARLAWTSPASSSGASRVAGYYVLRRTTDAATWETRLFVNGTSATVPYSIDNYLFAVQAVDADGHESIAVAAR